MEYTMEHTCYVFEDYTPDEGYTTWLLVTFDCSHSVRSEAVTRDVADIFQRVVGRRAATERPLHRMRTGKCIATSNWIAGPINGEEAQRINELSPS